MSLDEAVARFVSAVSEYFSAKKALEEELLKVGVSKRTAHVFIKNVEDSIRLGKKSPNVVPAPQPAKTEAPELGLADKGAEVEDKAGAGPGKKAKSPKKVGKWVLKDELKEGEMRIIDGRVYYKLDGKVKASKSVPLWTFRKVRVFFNPITGNYSMKALGTRGGVHHITENTVVMQARNIVRELNAGEVGAGELEVYSKLVKACLPKMRPLARDAIKLLLDEYDHWMKLGGDAE